MIKNRCINKIMDTREMKRQCFLEALDHGIVSVTMILNRLSQIESKNGVFDDQFLKRDKMETMLDLELALASVCILLRKMSENMYITLSTELRRDINSIIHSNRFDYNKEVIVYSQKGREEVDLEALLEFCRELLSNDKV